MAEEDSKDDFVEEVSEEKVEGQQGEGEVLRVRLPRGKEVLGIIEQRLGSSRMMVKCFDGNSRVCRVPGRFKRRLWLREGNIVLVEPWEFQSKEKGDIIYNYSKAAIEWLKRRGYVKIESEF
jgi:translation initiation factor 1A